MELNTTRVRRCLEQHDFRRLFIEELGWDRATDSRSVSVDGDTYPLQAIAQKRGMVAYLCQPPDLPEYRLRRRIEHQLSRFVQEHVVIYTGAAQTVQVWQWVRRQPGRPAACREHRYATGQPGDSLIQKLQAIAFSLAEEEGVTLVEVTGRVRAAFDVEHVTKRFYDRFQAEQKAFGMFIRGVPKPDELSWYVSVMLNRLMFIYFIQKKGLLNNDTDYLRSGLARVHRGAAGNYFQSFLKPLFFEGFALREQQRAEQTRALLGDVPYLNGGLFLKHSIEQAHPDIDIPDQAFERLFAFFEQYQWHLDDRPLRADNEINPDVLGYIFEKYINQKQMGAYYTKEDITEYITKNTVVPFLLDRIKDAYPAAFVPVSESNDMVWVLLRDNPDRYIYQAMQWGANCDIPPGIAAGLNDVSLRGEWNTPTPSEAGHPTEIWRETIARRRRYAEVRDRLTAGEVSAVNDLITLNLDIRQFAQDVIETCTDPVFLSAVWDAVTTVTVLDPTCGSGAFLFAALNILQPLYEACLERMERFLDDLPQGTGAPLGFREVLDRVAQHPNQRYFVLKTIMVNNLYGVDIMAEAVEIAKLRLFLKLVAEIDDANHIEPLPDIDFNIRAGNTLVGFATYDEVDRAVHQDGAQLRMLGLLEEDPMVVIDRKAQRVDELYQEFRQQQISLRGEVAPEIKAELEEHLDSLANELDRYLAKSYGVDPDLPLAFQLWRDSHQPFHWFVEFYDIVHKQGGFGVIVGNPPYVEYRKILKSYIPKGYHTLECGNLYAFVSERSVELQGELGRCGIIIPMSAFATRRMRRLKQLILDSYSYRWISNFGWRPAKLFDGVNLRLSIALMASQSGAGSETLSTGYQKWNGIARLNLFPTINYTEVHSSRSSINVVPKIGSLLEGRLLANILAQPSRLGLLESSRGHHVVYYKNTGVNHWITATSFAPKAYRDGELSASSRQTEFILEDYAKLVFALCCINSSLFYWFYIVTTNCRDLNPSDLRAFPIPTEIVADPRFDALSRALTESLDNGSEYVTRNQRQTGTIRLQSFQPRHSKPIIDEIDRVLAQHYGFTDEELDFIINYDIKYRMGDAPIDDGTDDEDE